MNAPRIEDLRSWAMPGDDPDTRLCAEQDPDHAPCRTGIVGRAA
ncbi:hypothetical protein [Streptomyces sp. NBC_00212]